MRKLSYGESMSIIDKYMGCVESVEIILDDAKKVLYSDNSTEEEFRQATFNLLLAVGKECNKTQRTVCDIIKRR